MWIQPTRTLSLAGGLHAKGAEAGTTPSPPRPGDAPAEPLPGPADGHDPGGLDPDPPERKTHGLRHHATHAMTGLHLLIEGAEMAGVLTGALVGGAIGSAAVALGLGALGVAHLRHGVKHDDADAIAEGTGSMILAARTGLNGVSLLGGMAHGSLAAAVAHLAHGVLPGLGVAHGVMDLGLGASRIYQGVTKQDSLKTAMGALGLGLGVSLCAAAVGGGLPAVAAAGSFLIGKMVVHEMEERRDRARGG